jgi:hypothetical protein
MNFRHLLAALLLSVSNWAAAVTLTYGGLLPVTPITIDNRIGDQFDPHVDQDLVVYSSAVDTLADGIVQEIRYYRFSTGTVSSIPNMLPDGTRANDLLSDVSQGRIVFTRVFPGVRSAIMLFDATTGTLSELAPAPASHYIGVAIGAQTVVFVDYGLVGDGSGEIMVLDLTTSALTRLTNDTVYDANPKVSPDGNEVTWERCVTGPNCDVYSATRSGSTWIIRPVAESPLNERGPDSNGTQIVFERDDLSGFTGSNIVLVPVAGGAETVLEIPGEQYNPSIRGQIVAFESRVGTGNPDIYIADLATNRLFQVTNTPSRAETLNDVTLLPTGEVRLVWQGAEETDPFNANIYAATFTLPPVVVADTTPPVLVVPANIAVDATSPSGAVVSYVATATDAIDPDPMVTCAPSSGSTFPVGTTAVTCTATDASGNSATASFNVTVFGAAEQIADLIDLVNSFHFRRGIEISLDAELRLALRAAGEGREAIACVLLGAFVFEVQALSGRGITAAQANQLIAAARQARASLGCN